MLPFVYAWANVIVVSASMKLFKSAQVVAAAEGAACIAAAAPNSSATRLALHRGMNDRRTGKEWGCIVVSWFGDRWPLVLETAVRTVLLDAPETPRPRDFYARPGAVSRRRTASRCSDRAGQQQLPRPTSQIT